MKHLPAFLLLVASCTPKPNVALDQQRYREAIDARLIQAGARVAEAFKRYEAGSDAEPSPEGRQAFRSECVAHATSRELVLDGLREHAQIHAYAWSTWYRDHCVSFVPGVINRETGQVVDAAVCDLDAGAAPARVYTKTDEEVLAQAQRDACERAQ